ncbi:MAG: hypothetical protein RLZ98_3173 [Pseudomonadota bacterium]|jgi:hypothetical protein
MRQTSPPHAIRLLALTIFLGLMPYQAAAVTCASQSVTAAGEPASYRWLALLKARGNWRTRVRSTPNLGPDYTGYSIASDVVEKCVSQQEGIVCTVTATPCRK